MCLFFLYKIVSEGKREKDVRYLSIGINSPKQLHVKIKVTSPIPRTKQWLNYFNLQTVVKDVSREVYIESTIVITEDKK
jgi:hypothetical protein